MIISTWTVSVVAKGIEKSLETNLDLGSAIVVLQRDGQPTGFVGDLIVSVITANRRGWTISAKQRNWLIFLAQERLNQDANPPADTTRETIGDFAKISSIFDGAKSKGLRFPKIRLALPNRLPVVLALVAMGRNAGSIRVTNGLGYGEDGSKFYGFISPDGTFGGRDKDVISLLKRFAVDPEAVSAEYGKMSGECCFCGRPITNGEAGSADVGYGPVCAERYGLAWEPNGRTYSHAVGAAVAV